MAREIKKRRGRPIKAPTEGERVPLSLRVTAEIRRDLEAAAAANGRSLSQEAELRLEQSFGASDLSIEMSMAFGPQLAGLLMMIGATLRQAGPYAAFSSSLTLEAAQEWLSHPYAFDQAAKAVAYLLEAARPDGKVVVPKHFAGLKAVVPQVDEQFGVGFARSLISAVQGHGASARLQKDGADIARLLGPIAKRIGTGGPTANAR